MYFNLLIDQLRFFHSTITFSLQITGVNMLLNYLFFVTLHTFFVLYKCHFSCTFTYAVLKASSVSVYFVTLDTLHFTFAIVMAPVPLHNIHCSERLLVYIS